MAFDARGYKNQCDIVEAIAHEFAHLSGLEDQIDANTPVGSVSRALDALGRDLPTDSGSFNVAIANRLKGELRTVPTFPADFYISPPRGNYQDNIVSPGTNGRPLPPLPDPRTPGVRLTPGDLGEPRSMSEQAPAQQTSSKYAPRDEQLETAQSLERREWWRYPNDPPAPLPWQSVPPALHPSSWADDLFDRRRSAGPQPDWSWLED